MKHYFEYSEAEIGFLKSKDKKLAHVIDQIGRIQREVFPDLFQALLHAVVGQQISTKAQVTIWKRMEERFSPITPDHIASIPVETLQTCGISMRKAAHISSMAQKIHSSEFDIAAIANMDDQSVCESLVALDGIGVWTAEMLMIFSMQRKNILSWGDLAILRGLRMLYRHRKITPALFEKYKKRYSPFASVASLYLWALAGGACEGYSDPAPQVKKKK